MVTKRLFALALVAGLFAPSVFADDKADKAKAAEASRVKYNENIVNFEKTAEFKAVNVAVEAFLKVDLSEADADAVKAETVKVADAVAAVNVDGLNDVQKKAWADKAKAFTDALDEVAKLEKGEAVAAVKDLKIADLAKALPLAQQVDPSASKNLFNKVLDWVTLAKLWKSHPRFAGLAVWTSVGAVAHFSGLLDPAYQAFGLKAQDDEDFEDAAYAA